MAFGKRNLSGNEPPRPPRPPQAPQTVAVERWPWEPSGTIRVDYAIDDLRESMLGWLKTKQGIHPESLMVAIGAVGGFAAQNVVWQMLSEPHAYVPSDGMLAVKAGSQTFFFGDLINGQLVGDASHPYRLWNLVVAAAIEAGMPAADAPNLSEIFRHVADSVGKPNFGIPRVPKGVALLYTPRRALDLFWPRVKFILTRTDAPGPARGTAVAPEHWPVVTGLVARQFVALNQTALDPRISVELVMESAIAMSKVDPKTVPQQMPTGS